MKIQIKEVMPGQWAIYFVSSVAVSAGRTTYATSDEAERVARNRHPGKEIEVIR